AGGGSRRASPVAATPAPRRSCASSLPNSKRGKAFGSTRSIPARWFTACTSWIFPTAQGFAPSSRQVDQQPIVPAKHELPWRGRLLGQTQAREPLQQFGQAQLP